MEKDLRESIGRGELRLYFQPAYSLADATIGSVEALLRWDRSGYGILAPSEFLALAERSTLIFELGDWTIEEACRQLARWRSNLEQAELYVAVNISPLQLSRGDPVETLRVAAAETGAPASRLALEIPAATLTELPERALHRLTGLRDLDSGIVIDNVTDAGAIAERAAALPLRAIRMASSVISGLPDSETCMILSRDVLELGAELGVETIAQGVESPGQLQSLRELGCDYASGFLFSVPMPTEPLEEALRGNVRPARSSGGPG